MKEIDARGKPCPQPVLLLKGAMEQGESVIRVTVDNEGAVQNLTRFTESKGFQVKNKKTGEGFIVEVKKVEYEQKENESGITEKGDTVLFVSSNILGKDSKELGKILMKAFFGTLKDGKIAVKKIIFLNSGVKLTSRGSDLIDILKTLEENGVEILSCGTCLDYFGLKEKLSIGKISNAYEILSSLENADKIIPFS